jgi:hypothetical protein
VTFFGATLFTAIATAVLAAFAIVTAILAYMAFRKQSKEVRDQAEMLKVQADRLAEERKVSTEQIRVLGLQAEELRQAAAARDREAHERRRAQAELVYMRAQIITTVEPDKPFQNRFIVTVHNTSQQPIYDPIYRPLHKGQLVGSQIWHVLAIMPGETDDLTIELRQDPDPSDWGAAIMFRDRAGVWWLAWDDGRLEEVPSPQRQTAPADSAPTGETAPDMGEQAP